MSGGKRNSKNGAFVLTKQPHNAGRLIATLRPPDASAISLLGASPELKSRVIRCKFPAQVVRELSP
jgi:hypothetical protein